MVQISSVLPFRKRHNVSSNTGNSDLRHAVTCDRRLMDEKLNTQIKANSQQCFNSCADKALVSQPRGPGFDPGWDQFFFCKISEIHLKCFKIAKIIKIMD